MKIKVTDKSIDKTIEMDKIDFKKILELFDSDKKEKEEEK